MAANFETRPIGANEWRPEVCGVDFTERMNKRLGFLAAQGSNLWTTWVTLDAEGDDMPEITFQVTQENCQMATSHAEDDADTILLLDPRDGMHFRYTRLTHPHIFDWVSQAVAPWCIRISSLVPLEQNYKPALEQMERDLGGEESTFIPDDWK